MLFLMLLKSDNLCKSTLSEYISSDAQTTTGRECPGKTQDHRRRVYTSTSCGASNSDCECFMLWLYVMETETFVLEKIYKKESGEVVWQSSEF